MDAYGKNKLARSPYFSGREREVSLLHQGLEQSFQRKGKSFLITGNAGMGKSRLLRETLDRAGRQHAFSTLEYVFLPAGTVQPSLFKSLFDQCIDIFVSGEDAQGKPENVAMRIGIAHALARHAFDELAGESRKPDTWISLDQNTRRAITAAVIWDFLNYLSTRNPLVLIIEDIHWADIELKFFLQDLTAKLKGAKITLLLSARRHLPEFIAGSDFTACIDLKPLSVAEQEDLIGRWLGTSGNVKALKDDILRVSEGSPLFLNMLMSFLNESGYLTGTGTAGPSFTCNEKNTDLPSTLRSLIEMRLLPLMELQKQHVHCAVVIGQRFTRDLLVQLAGGDRAVVDETLAYLKESNLIFRVEGSPQEEEYQFCHALIPETIYNNIPEKQRCLYHNRLFNVLRSGRRSREKIPLYAHHALKGQLFREAFLYNYLAGSDALSRSDAERAAACFRSAIDSLGYLLPKLRNGVRYLVKSRIGLASALSIQGRHYEARAILKMAEEDLRTMAVRPKSLENKLKSMSLFDIWIQGDLAGGIKIGGDFLAGLHLREDPHNYVTTAIRLAGMLQDHGRYEESNKVLHKLDGFFKPENAASRYGILFPPSAACHAIMSRNYGELGQFDQARKQAARCREFLGHDRNILAMIYGLSYSATYLIRAEKFAEALPFLSEAHGLCEQFKNNLLYPFAASHYGFALTRSGRKEEGFVLMEEACGIAKKQAAYGRKALYIQLLAEARLMNREYDLAQDLSSKAIAIGKKFSEQANVARSYYTIGLASQQQGLDGTAFIRMAQMMAADMKLQPLLESCQDALTQQQAA